MKNITNVLVLSVMSLFLATSAYADTYNFFFSKKKSKNKVEAQQQEESSDDENTNPAPANAAVQKDTVQIQPSQGQSPIIINNNLASNPSPTTPTVPAPTAPVVTPSQAPIANSAYATDPLVTRVDMKPISTGLFRRGLFLGAGLTLGAGASYSGTYYYYAAPSHLTVDFGYAFSKLFAMNAFGGISPVSLSSAYGGIEGTLYPLHSHHEGYDTFDLGLVAGASTIATAPGNILSAHLGLRTNLNFSEVFGLTATIRGNAGYSLFQAGFVYHI